ncbi:Hypothetical_protein [Hexamita inflata]|uniref:Hypothetical_protein n=1 Tax=Hexamita inflata TaxID=28002 RepID=A0AA86Q164_9EUKA|nr:Hypothetical protein HINF_LOCUS32485 [Hexamita inflata]
MWNFQVGYEHYKEHKSQFYCEIKFIIKFSVKWKSTLKHQQLTIIKNTNSKVLNRQLCKENLTIIAACLITLQKDKLALTIKMSTIYIQFKLTYYLWYLVNQLTLRQIIRYSCKFAFSDVQKIVDGDSIIQLRLDFIYISLFQQVKQFNHRYKVRTNRQQTIKTRQQMAFISCHDYEIRIILQLNYIINLNSSKLLVKCICQFCRFQILLISIQSLQFRLDCIKRLVSPKVAQFEKSTSLQFFEQKSKSVK